MWISLEPKNEASLADVIIDRFLAGNDSLVKEWLGIHIEKGL